MDKTPAICILLFAVGIGLYSLACRIGADCTTLSWNRNKRPYPDERTVGLQTAGFFLLFFCTGPVLLVGWAVQLLAKALLHWLSSAPTAAAAAAAASGDDSTSITGAATLSRADATLSTSPLSVVVGENHVSIIDLREDRVLEEGDAEAQQQRRREDIYRLHQGSSSMLRRALVAFAGLPPLRAGRSSWAAQNRLESERRRRERRRRRRQQQLQAPRDTGSPLPTYDGARLPPYEAVLEEDAVARRERRGDGFAEQRVLGGLEALSSVQCCGEELRLPPPAYH
ncbi:uncharacterized protein PG986_009650 [Apiospora aurea]|uniref:Uncharacterized protein n=1 Tax=Apiospora aurea TaxID=335848 RepID=A0ABR1Q8M9_9PEZI